ncbi:uncharacterized protein LOC131243895 [Magnolia sinica]|uniref:uncharacterized protein LOC131243895 n=1 Tax=Magnolia sinica TaxID=86752 RepID=UPI002659D9C1|nr:uncharacterized protein LOC131243895 [Magnolia sinica]
MAKAENSPEDIEAGGHRRSASSSVDSLCFSDAEDESWHSPLDSCGGGSFECHLSDASDAEIGGASEQHPRRNSSASDHRSDASLESKLPEIKVHLAKAEKDCRICQLSLESANQESGILIELGCSCKNDLATAHKQCAEAWFRLKGNKTCEICGATARNVVGVTEPEIIEQWTEPSNTVTAAPTESRSFWHGHRFLNFLLACMVFAFVISWLFHFNVSS